MSLLKELWAYKLKHFHQLTQADEAVSAANSSPDGKPDKSLWKRRYLRLYAAEGDVLPKLRYYEGKSAIRRSRGTLALGRDCILAKDPLCDRVLKVAPTHGKPSIFMFIDAVERDEMLAMLRDLSDHAMAKPAPPSSREVRQASRKGLRMSLNLRHKPPVLHTAKSSPAMVLVDERRATSDAAAAERSAGAAAAAAAAAGGLGSTSGGGGSGVARGSAKSTPMSFRTMKSASASALSGSVLPDSSSESESSMDEGSDVSELMMTDGLGGLDDLLEFSAAEDADVLPLSDEELAEHGLARADLACGGGVCVMLPLAEGSASLHNAALGLTLGAGAVQGKRKYMEDRHVLHPHFGDDRQAYWGVYDGHGGDQISERLTTTLHAHVATALEEADAAAASSDGGGGGSDLSAPLIAAYEACDAEASQWAFESQIFAGSTANSLLLRGDTLYCANAGDCRAVLCRGGVALDLSRAHNPAAADEQQRILDAGGHVRSRRVNGILAVSRAFGDIELKKVWRASSQSTVPEASRNDIIIARPEVQKETIVPGDLFLIVACDGLWDVMSSQQAVDYTLRFLLKTRDADATARLLADKAVDSGSVDNVTVIVALLRQHIEL